MLNAKCLWLPSDEEFSRQARDRLSGALTSAVDFRERALLLSGGGGIGAAGEAADLLDGIPDLTDGLDTPLKRIIK